MNNLHYSLDIQYRIHLDEIAVPEIHRDPSTTHIETNVHPRRLRHRKEAIEFEQLPKRQCKPSVGYEESLYDVNEDVTSVAKTESLSVVITATMLLMLTVLFRKQIGFVIVAQMGLFSNTRH